MLLWNWPTQYIGTCRKLSKGQSCLSSRQPGTGFQQLYQLRNQTNFSCFLLWLLICWITKMGYCSNCIFYQLILMGTIMVTNRKKTEENWETPCTQQPLSDLGAFGEVGDDTNCRRNFFVILSSSYDLDQGVNWFRPMCSKMLDSTSSVKQQSSLTAFALTLRSSSSHSRSSTCTAEHCKINKRDFDFIFWMVKYKHNRNGWYSELL